MKEELEKNNPQETESVTTSPEDNPVREPVFNQEGSQEDAETDEYADDYGEEPEEDMDNPVKEVFLEIGGFFQFLGRTTVQFFRNLPGTISNKINAKIAERRRMPKRRSMHKVYVLVGYTTKEYVDRKYRKERMLLIIRRILVGCIIVIILAMAFRWFIPKLDTDEYKQMIGINEMDELTKNDPFATETSNEAIAPESQAVTPIPSNTSDTSSAETKPGE